MRYFEVRERGVDIREDEAVALKPGVWEGTTLPTLLWSWRTPGLGLLAIRPWDKRFVYQYQPSDPRNASEWADTFRASPRNRLSPGESRKFFYQRQTPPLLDDDIQINGYGALDAGRWARIDLGRWRSGTDCCITAALEADRFNQFILRTRRDPSILAIARADPPEWMRAA